MLDMLFAFGRIVAAVVHEETKAVLVNTRLLEESTTAEDATSEVSNNEPMFGQLGVVAVPDPADELGHTEVISLRQSDGAQPIAQRDLRLNARLNPKIGSINLVQYGGGFVSLEWNKDKAGTSIVLLAPKLSGATIEKSHAISMDTQGAKPAISIMHMDGHCLLLTHQKKALLKSANGKHFIGVDDGGVLLAGLIKLFGGIVAGNSQAAQPVALFPAHAAAWTATAAMCAAMQALCTELAAVPELAAAVPAIGAAGTAFGALATAATAAATPITGASQTLKASPI